MSVKIKVSYTDEEELARVIRLLSPAVKSWKKQPAKGKYKRAYVVLHEVCMTTIRESPNICGQ